MTSYKGTPPTLPPILPPLQQNPLARPVQPDEKQQDGRNECNREGQPPARRLGPAQLPVGHRASIKRWVGSEVAGPGLDVELSSFVVIVRPVLAIFASVGRVEVCGAAMLDEEEEPDWERVEGGDEEKDAEEGSLEEACL
jgi:hypothetical protein